MFSATDIVDDVREVLRGSCRGKGDEPCFLTAYQILNRLDAGIARQLILERGLSGKGAGRSYSAASLVADAAEVLSKRGEVAIAYLDCGGISVRMDTGLIEPGYEVCGLYRFTG